WHDGLAEGRGIEDTHIAIKLMKFICPDFT
ncbi:MAG: hypothetical protein ACI9QV_001129, partial [Methylophagaceae bacterium]